MKRTDGCFRWAFLLALIFCVGFCAPALAGMELTPFVGYRFGGDFDDPVDGSSADLEEGVCYGLVFDYDLDTNSQVELFWSHRDAELKSTFTDGGSDSMNLKIDYLHLGGTYGEPWGGIEPFVVGGMGLTHFNSSTSGYGSKTKFSMSLGVGAKSFLTEHFGLRFEARGYGTFFDGSGDILCGPQGCFAHINSSVWLQFELNAGVVFAF